MLALQERMNKLFEDSLTRSRTTDAEEGFPMGSWSPPVDIYETDDKVVLRADIPGVAQKDIDVRIEEGTLIVRGDRKFDPSQKQEDYLRIERSYGPFQRTFRLPSTVDQGKVNAVHRDGVLEVMLQKREETRPRQIKVEVK
jgi:HSP20 family protein